MLNFSAKQREPFNFDRLQTTLQALTQSSEYPPPSMAEVSRRLNHDQSHLLKLFPELCHLVSKRYRDHRRSQSIQRKQRVKNEIQQAMLKVHLEGKYPSRRQVRGILSDPSLMRLPEANETWRTTLQEFGWSESKAKSVD